MKEMPLSAKLCVCLLVPLVWLWSCGGEPADDMSGDQAGKDEGYFKIDPGTAATIRGRVIFEGEEPEPQVIDVSGDPDCARLHPGGTMTASTVAVGQNQGVANAFVSIKDSFDDLKFRTPKDPVVIDQKGCVYHPRVVGLQVGQKLSFTNGDPLAHNVHPLPRYNRESNRMQNAGAEPIEMSFARPELMLPVKCNLHPWMIAFVNVVPHPFFAVSKADGSFEISGLPAGDYTLQVSHERLGTREIQVQLKAGESKEVEFRYSEQDL